MAKNNLFDSGGFRLDNFQLYNWGIFDERIYTMRCNGESALLTGDNGSGKTTLVDALISLLVPVRFRFYNQSSGADQKRERTEETYVLGARNTKREGENNSAQAEYLRVKQNALSCLLGVFSNNVTGAAVSLLQVRYFSGEGKLQQVYAITQRAASLEDINTTLGKANLLFDRQGKWKKLLQDSFEFVFFGDSFKKYSARFSQIFGFRSDKALNLFSQTVGVKVLDNLNDFIRTKMFEQLDMEEEFGALHKNYSDLLTSYNEIEKTQEQLRLLEPILESGKKLDVEKQKEAEYRLLGDTIVIWFCRNAIELTEGELKNEHSLKNIDAAKRIELETGIQRLDQNIQELRTAIAQDKENILLMSLESKITQAEKDKRVISDNLEKYQRNAALADCMVPKTASQFEKNRQQLEKHIGDFGREAQRIRDLSIQGAVRQKKITDQIEAVRSELTSLSERQTNIPLENIRIREFICQGIGCSVTDIPFAGELIQVAPGEEHWTRALEKLLHHFGLSLVVPEALYKKVNAFVHGHNLKGRVVYYKADERDADIFLDSNGKLAKDKLQVKQDHPLGPWVSAFIRRRFDYVCTDDMKEFALAEKAVTSSGLIKAQNRHEKDDRERSAFSMQILGWNNRAKRQELSSRLEELVSEQTKAEEETGRLRENENRENEKQSACERILEFSNWASLDIQSFVSLIENYIKEKNQILNSASAVELKMLQSRIDICWKEMNQMNSERDKLIGSIGSRDERIRNLDDELSELRNAASVFANEPDLDEKIANFTAALGLQEAVETIPRLKQLREEKNQVIHRELDRCGNSIKTYTANIQRAMNAFINPDRRIADKYPSWRVDTRTLTDTVDGLDDYRHLGEKLEKDDLPRYKNEFSIYLKEQLSDGIISFHQVLESWEQKIKTGIGELNRSLKLIPYNKNPDTYLALDYINSADSRIQQFRAQLRATIPDMGMRYSTETENTFEAEEGEFLKIQELIHFLKEDDNRRKLVLDVRNWFNFSAIEYYTADNSQKQFYQNSASLSGGEKAKLAYTILASAIAFQFGINDASSSDNSFRFVIIDEAFSKIDPQNSRYAMELFRLLDLQLLVVTPMDKINVVESYIHSVHLTENQGRQDSRLISMTIQQYREEKEAYVES